MKFASGIKHVDVATPKSIAGPCHVVRVFSQWPSVFASPRLYQLLNIYNPATIDRFHMTTHTTLSAAAPAPQAQPRLEPRFQWHRHSCLPRGTRGLCAVAWPGGPRLATPSASLPVHVLIANLELEFYLSVRKPNTLEIPNRKFLTISNHFSQSFGFSLRNSSFASRHWSSVTHASLLIYGSAIKTPPNPLKT